MSWTRWAHALLAAGVAMPATAATCPPSRSDERAIERTVHAFYHALGKDDRGAFDATVTRDFLAVDVNKKFTAPELFEAVAASHKAGRTINWGVGPMTIRVDCQMASARWDNVGSAGIPPAIAPRSWWESAVLRRSAKGWRIEFFHSTLQPAATR